MEYVKTLQYIYQGKLKQDFDDFMGATRRVGSKFNLGGGGTSFKGHPQ
jgi:hypothetical protein